MLNILKMTNDRALNKYGEYGVPYKVAKKLDCFKVNWNTPYEKAKELIKEFIINGTTSKEFYKMDAICVMEFGNIDIEFMSYGINDEDKFDTGFYCCANWEDDGWESHGFSDLIFNLEILEDRNKFEEVMYNSMIEYAKNNKLFWSKEN